MKRSVVLSLGLAVLLTGISSAQAQQNGTLEVRLVAAGNDDAANSARGLEDILPLLRKNLRFASYRLISEKRAALANGVTMNLGLGYALAVSEVADGLATVQVSRGTSRLLRTRLQLHPDRPVILGGFQHANDTTLIMVVNLKVE